MTSEICHPKRRAGKKKSQEAMNETKNRNEKHENLSACRTQVVNEVEGGALLLIVPAQEQVHLHIRKTT